MRQLSKRDRIVVLLRTFNDTRETLQREDAGKSLYPDSRALYMPNAWKTGGYEELVRALVRLRLRAPKEYWHVTHRYLRSTKRRTDVTRRGEEWVGLRHNQRVFSHAMPEGEERRRTRPKGDASKSERDFVAIVESWDEGVDVTVVAEGISMLVKLYSGWPRLPDEVYWNNSA